MNLKINGANSINIFSIKCKCGAANRAVLAALLSCLLALMLICPTAIFAAEVDYQELQEDPLETAFRKLQSTGGIEWDKEEMIEGPPPAFVKGMAWPLKSCTISRGFRFKRRRHMGMDLLAAKGTPIMAVLNGVVEVVSTGGGGFRGYGKTVIVNHGNKLWTLYSHCATTKVHVGQRVRRGEVIATVGRTGRATANHLHFEVRSSRGTPVNPMKYLPPNPFVKNL